MWKKIKKIFSFRFADVLGLLTGVALISVSSDTELFYLVIAPQMYLIMFLVVFLLRTWLWILLYHGEQAYTKHMIGGSIKDFFCLAFACISVIGIYFLYHSFIV